MSIVHIAFKYCWENFHVGLPVPRLLAGTISIYRRMFFRQKSSELCGFCFSAQVKHRQIVWIEWSGKMRAAAQYILHCGTWGGLGAEQNEAGMFIVFRVFLLASNSLNYVTVRRYVHYIIIFSVWRRTLTHIQQYKGRKKGEVQLTQTYMFGYS